MAISLLYSKERKGNLMVKTPKKSYLTALLLSIFVGGFGVDRFYVGHIGLGLAKLFTLGGCGVWYLIDIILFATRQVKDAQGRDLE